MGINNLSAFGNAIGGRGLAVANNAGQQQQVNTTGGPISFDLEPTKAQIIPAGNFMVQAGLYSCVQVWDNQSYMWRLLSTMDNAPTMISSDGTNYRVANTTGQVIGAVVTNKGTANTGVPNGFYGYNYAGSFVQIQGGVTTTGLTTATATIIATTTGGATLNTWIGGAVTSVTYTAGTTANTGFVVPPQLIVVPPASQGNQPFLPCTLKAVLTGSAISSVVVVNQGAGYVAAPTILVVNAPGDVTGVMNSSTLTAVLGLANQLAAITVANGGTTVGGITSVPTITMSGTTTITSAAATALMNLSVVSLAMSGAGAAYGTSLPVTSTFVNGSALPATTNTQPAVELGILPILMQPNVVLSSAAGGTITATPTVLYGGSGFYSPPVASISATGTTVPTTLATYTVTTGGNNDTIYMFPI